MADHTISIHTSQNGSGGAKVSVHKSMLKSALTVEWIWNLLDHRYCNGPTKWNTIDKKGAWTSWMQTVANGTDQYTIWNCKRKMRMPG